MADAKLSIGGRSFRIAYEKGQEESLLSAATYLDEEATAISSSNANIHDAQLLLMAGLVIADRLKTLELEKETHDEVQSNLEKRLSAAEKKFEENSLNLSEEETKKIETLENSLIESEDKLVQANLIIEQRTSRIARLQNRLKSVENEAQSSDGASNISEELNLAQTKISENELTISALQAELLSVKSRLEQQATQASNNTQVEDHSQNTQQLENEYNTLKAKHGELLELEKSQSEKIMTLTQSEANLRNKVEELNATVSEQSQLEDVQNVDQDATKNAQDKPDDLMDDLLAGLERLVSK